jgi:hypothetical protein
MADEITQFSSIPFRHWFGGRGKNVHEWCKMVKVGAGKERCRQCCSYGRKCETPSSTPHHANPSPETTPSNPGGLLQHYSSVLCAEHLVNHPAESLR